MGDIRLCEPLFAAAIEQSATAPCMQLSRPTACGLQRTAREDREIGVAARESIEADLAIPDGCKLVTSKFISLSGGRRRGRDGDGAFGWTYRGDHGPDADGAHRPRPRRHRPQLRRFPR